MRDLRCALAQSTDVVLRRTVRIRHLVVPAQMFDLRFDQERLEELTEVGGVFEDSPRVGAVPSNRGGEASEASRASRGNRVALRTRS
jgi:hypothetical protein